MSSLRDGSAGRYPSAPARRSPSLPILGAGMLWLSACGEGDPLAPPPPFDLRIASVTEWVASEPDRIQVGTFTYDASGRLVRYEFGANIFTPDVVQTLTTTYEYDGDRLTANVMSVRPVGETVFTEARRVTYGYDEFGRVTSTRLRSVNEGTGRTDTATIRYEYDRHSRLVTEITPDEYVTYRYDERDNVVAFENRLDQGSGLEPTIRSTFTYDGGANPFYGIPPQAGMVFILAPNRTLSRNNLLSSSNRGAPDFEIASFAEGRHEYDGEGRLIRSELTFANSFDPVATSTTVVTVIEYVDP